MPHSQRVRGAYCYSVMHKLYYNKIILVLLLFLNTKKTSHGCQSALFIFCIAMLFRCSVSLSIDHQFKLLIIIYNYFDH